CEMKEERDRYQKELEEANRLISELEVYKEEYEKVLAEWAGEEQKIQDEKKRLEEKSKELQKLTAQGDKEGFRKYFETINEDVAEEIYREIMLQEKQDTDIKNFIQIYENMDESAAARILSEIGEEKIQLVVEILLQMKKENASAILGSMDAVFASKITEKMAEALLKKQ
ncbi:MAG: hypothetical protein GX754_10435, partial [Clostridiaceae bacterium]|nr:hypothetical protein [Clostridiaceae bacterium]